MTKSEEIKALQALYNKTERVADEYGRMFGVRRLKPSQQLLVQEMAPGLEGAMDIRDDETGEVIAMPRISPLILAASVSEVDGAPVTFAKNRGELNAILDMLDRPGLAAVAEGLAKLNAEAVAPAGTGIEAAKN